jgi:nucleotide-binding universal stress UspA family protein
MKGTVVVGFVDTAVGRAAVDAAVRECQLRSARLVVVSSVTGGPGNELYAQRDAVARLTDEVAQAGTEMDVREYARGNDPATDLLKVAEEVNADLIVIGLRRRSPVGKLLLGSNAQKILLESDIPVLAVKPSQH